MKVKHRGGLDRLAGEEESRSILSVTSIPFELSSHLIAEHLGDLRHEVAVGLSVLLFLGTIGDQPSNAPRAVLVAEGVGEVRGAEADLLLPLVRGGDCWRSSENA
jgi:hypothetical protein